MLNDNDKTAVPKVSILDGNLAKKNRHYVIVPVPKVSVLDGNLSKKDT